MHFKKIFLMLTPLRAGYFVAVGNTLLTEFRALSPSK